MRVYNATSCVINFPLTPTQKITVQAKSVSGNILPNTQFLSMMVGVYTPDEIAFIVSGPFEINMCSGIPVTASYVVQSLDEAIQRFSSKPVVESKPQPVVEEKIEVEPVLTEEVKVEVEPVSVSPEELFAEAEAATAVSEEKKTVKKRSKK